MVLHGVAAAPGIATAAPVVILGEGLPETTSPGGILVARVIHPYLAPLLARMGGVVVEDGGILQHAAILAREFRIPAVVGVENAVRFLGRAELVRLDGTTGEVAIVGQK